MIKYVLLILWVIRQKKAHPLTDALPNLRLSDQRCLPRKNTTERGTPVVRRIH